MGCFLSSPVASSQPPCSSWEREEYEWRLSCQEHWINQLKIRLRHLESENTAFRQEVGGPRSAHGLNVLSGVALRYGQSHAKLDTRQLLQDLAVLNFYQRHTLNTLAYVPVLPSKDPLAPRVRFDWHASLLMNQLAFLKATQYAKWRWLCCARCILLECLLSPP